MVINSYLESKLPDISDTCYMYSTYGLCPSSIACRFGSTHISDEGENIIDESLHDEKRASPVCNVLPKQLQIDLRKKRVCFPRSAEYLKSLELKKNSVTATVPEDSACTGVSLRKENENEDLESESSQGEEAATVVEGKAIGGENENEDMRTGSNKGGVTEKEAISGEEKERDEETINEDTVIGEEERPVEGQIEATNNEGGTSRRGTDDAVTNSLLQEDNGDMVVDGPCTDEERIALKPRERKKVFG